MYHIYLVGELKQLLFLWKVKDDNDNGRELNVIHVAVRCVVTF